MYFYEAYNSFNCTDICLTIEFHSETPSLPHRLPVSSKPERRSPHSVEH